MNSTVPPFDDPKVRQAANYAVDREAIVKILGGDLQGTPTSGILSDTMLPEGYPAEVYPSTPDVEQGQGAAGGGRRPDARSTPGRCTTPRPA